MTLCVKYHDAGATVEQDGEILHAYGWPRDGGHVWETITGRGAPYNRNVCYRGSRSTILTEETPRKTALHIADIHGIPDDRVHSRWGEVE